MKEIDIPLYGGILAIEITHNIKKTVSKYRLPKEAAERCGFMYATSRDGRALYIVVIDAKHATAGLIAHEALHVVNAVMHEIRAVPDWQNDEAQAYLLAWVVDEIHKCPF